MSFVSLQSPTPQWGTYLDLELDAKPYIQMPTPQPGQAPGVQNVTPDPILQTILDAACTWAQDYLGRPINPTEFSRRFDGWAGWNGAYIMLPYFPVLQVVSATEWWGLSGPHVLAEQTPQAQFGVGQTAVGNNTYQIDPVDGKLIRTFPGLIPKPFFPGSRNIEVTWIAGYNPVPADVRLATLELFAWWYRNTQEAPRTVGRHSGYQPEADLWPAVPNRVTMMLEPYMQQGMA